MRVKNKNSVITAFQQKIALLRAISMVVVAAFGLQLVAPALQSVQAAQAVQITREKDNSDNSSAPGRKDKLGKSLCEARDTLLQVKTELQQQKISNEGFFDLVEDYLFSDRKGSAHDEALDSLDALRSNLFSVDGEVTEEFEELGKTLRKKKVPDLILNRHDNMVSSYRGEFDFLMNSLDDALKAKDDDALLISVETAYDRLASMQLAPKNQPFDPASIKDRIRQPDPAVKPRLSEEEFREAGLFNTPYIKVAALGDFQFGDLAGASDPAYLAESAEVVLSQFVRDQAEELGYDPVAIFHWVRNNFAWLPSWGAIQNSDLTLGSMQGNAMDIASLTIALLRAPQAYRPVMPTE